MQMIVYALGSLRKKIENVYIYICHWLSNGRKIFNIWSFKTEYAKNLKNQCISAYNLVPAHF